MLFRRSKSVVPFRRLRWVFPCLLLAFGAARLHGQELRGQQSPLTAWLDLRPTVPGAPPQTTPAWIESLDFLPAQTDAAKTPLAPASPARAEGTGQGVDRTYSVYRVRLQSPVAGVNDLQLRVFFDDLAGDARPFVSVWNELGTELMRSNPLGQGLGLPSSETLTIPMKGVDYLEISLPGDGTQVRALFLSWLEKTRVLQPVDFPAQEAVHEPFHVLASTRQQTNDSYLYGVVTASLQPAEAAVLKPASAPAATFEFQLEHQPLIAVISYEVLGAAAGAAPLISVNQHSQGQSELFLPDLADPGYRGEQTEGSSQMTFRYTGWVRAQKMVPAEMLNAGLNRLTVSLSEGSGTVAIRSLQIQLKYNWEKLDYNLAPTPATYESH